MKNMLGKLGAVSLGLTGLMVMALASAPAMAAGPYFMLTAGQSELDDDSFNAAGVDIDNEDTGFAVGAGYRYGTGLGGEVSYVNFGDYGLTGTPLNIEATTFAFAGTYSYSLFRNVNIMGKLGVHLWEVDIPVGSISISDDGTDLLYGVNLGYRFSKRLGTFVGYDIYELDDEDVSYLHGGVRFHF